MEDHNINSERPSPEQRQEPVNNFPFTGNANDPIQFTDFSDKQLQDDNILIIQTPEIAQPQSVQPSESATGTVDAVRIQDETQSKTPPVQKKKADNQKAKPVYATIEIGGKVISIDPKRNVVGFTMDGEEALAFYTVLQQRFNNRKKLSGDTNQLVRQCVYAALTGVGIAHGLDKVPVFKNVIIK